MGYKLNNHGLFMLFALLVFIESMVSRFFFRYYIYTYSHGGPMAVHCILVSLEKWAVLIQNVGDAI